jgi:hypothetical protein
MLSVKIPVHIHFNAVSNTKFSRMHAGVEKYQGNILYGTYGWLSKNTMIDLMRSESGYGYALG